MHVASVLAARHTKTVASARHVRRLDVTSRASTAGSQARGYIPVAAAYRTEQNMPRCLPSCSQNARSLSKHKWTLLVTKPTQCVTTTFFCLLSKTFQPTLITLLLTTYFNCYKHMFNNKKRKVLPLQCASSCRNM